MYKKIFRIAFLFATGICMTACSSGDDNIADNTTPVNPDTKKKEVILTGTISIDSDMTRAVDKDGKISWTTGDEVYVVYKQSGTTYSHTKGTITKVSATEASFTAKLEDPLDNGHIGLAYPYSKVANYSTGDNFTFTFNYDGFSSQSGTPNYISTNRLDYASSETDQTMTISGRTASLSDNIILKNQVCICQFNLKYQNTKSAATYFAPYYATGLTVTAGSDTYTITPASATSTVYVAMKPVSGQTVTLQATGGITLTESSTLEPSTTALAAGDVGKIIGVDNTGTAKLYTKSTGDTKTKTFANTTVLKKGKFYKQDVKIAEDVTPIAVVAHVGAVANYCEHFIALALEDATDAVGGAAAGELAVKNWVQNHAITIESNTYDQNNIASRGSHASYDAFDDDDDNIYQSPSLIKGWRVPTVADFCYIFQSLCSGPIAPNSTDGKVIDNGEYGNGNALRTAIDGACGNTIITDHANTGLYWTGTTHYDSGSGTTKIWRYNFALSAGHFIWTSGLDNSRVRMVLAY